MISKKRCFLYVKNANLAKKLLEIIGFLPIFQSGKVESIIDLILYTGMPSLYPAAMAYFFW
jgi:hypothetical protein